MLSDKNTDEGELQKKVELSFSSPDISDTKYEDLENGVMNAFIPQFNHQFSCETKATSTLLADASDSQAEKP